MKKTTPLWKKISLKNLFRQKPDRFVELLIQQAALTEDGMKALVEYFDNPDKAHAEAVAKIEETADEIRRILIDELNRTFVTPFDREDIHALSRAIDDMLDYGYSTTVEMEILEVSPNDYMRQIGQLLLKMANEIHMAVERLSDHLGVAQSHAVRAKQLENRVENLYRQALADLFHQPKDTEHIVEMLKYRETYRHLSNASDRGDEAANVLSDIVVKMG
jgi:predicted phosphate transport protein (TIGR00153 family)